MAAIKPTIVAVGRRDNSALMISWLAVTENDTCNIADVPDLADKSIHVSGTFGGATVTLLGSNNSFATTGVGLRGPDSVAISFTSEGLKQVLENTGQIKPVAAGGTAQSLNIYVLAKQSNPLRQ